MSRGSVVRLASAAAAAFVLQAVCLAQTHRIDGQVLDRKNTALVGVRVTLYRGTTPLPTSARTNSRGEYTIAFEAGSPISVVRYDLTNWYPSKVENISGARDHRINKVLISTADTLDSRDRAEIIQTLITLKALDVANKVPESRLGLFYDPLLNAMIKQGSKEVAWDEEFVARDRTMKSALMRTWGDFDRMGRHKWGDYDGAVEDSFLMDVKDAAVERAGHDGVRLTIDAASPPSGWGVFAFQYKAGDAIHVYVVGGPLTEPSSEPTPAVSPYAAGGTGPHRSITRTYGNLAGINRIVVHARDRVVTIPTPREPSHKR